MSAAERSGPRYQQIALHYRKQIARGILQPGDKLPSERTIAALWRVARPTAARALHTLNTQGIIEPRQGAGYYVTEHGRLPIDHPSAEAPPRHRRPPHDVPSR